MSFQAFANVGSKLHPLKRFNMCHEPTRPTLGTRARSWCPKLFTVTVLAVASTNCSLQDFDSLSAGSGSGGKSSANGGSATSIATATGAVSGTRATANGGFDAGGRGVTGGAEAIVNAGAAGDLSGSGGNGAGGTNQAPGGTTSKPVSGVCPAFEGTGGTLITPPSNDFEANFDGWVRMSGIAGLVRVEGDGTACSGTAYLASGAFRKGGWDGPVLDLMPYMQPGHSYQLTLAARYNSTTVPPSERMIGMTVVTACSESEVFYSPLSKLRATSNWVRLQSVAPIVFPPSACLDVKMASVYVETDDADMNLSFDIDDFRLIEVTAPSVGGGGAAGAAGAAPVDVGGNAGAGGSGA